jgi:hypothetical protein
VRSEIIAGRIERLAALLPSFSHLVTLPFAGREGAGAANGGVAGSDEAEVRQRG